MMTKQEEVISRLYKIHGDKYNFDYVKYINSLTKVKIWCNSCSLFFYTSTKILLRGSGCSICANKSSAKLRMKSTDDVIRDFRLVHGERFDYSLMVYSGNKRKIKIICKCCQEANREYVFEQTPNSHLSGEGCTFCSLLERNENLKYDKDVVIRKIKSIFPQYDFSLFDYKQYDEKSTAICKKHGEFLASAHSLISSNGCPVCAHRGKTSRIETKWLNLLGVREEFRNTLVHIGGKCRFPDGINPERKVIYEMLGDIYHGNPDLDPNKFHYKSKKTYSELYESTRKRLLSFLDEGYEIYYIWEKDFRSYLKSKSVVFPLIYKYTGGDILTYKMVLDIYRNYG